MLVFDCLFLQEFERVKNKRQERLYCKSVFIVEDKQKTKTKKQTNKTKQNKDLVFDVTAWVVTRLVDNQNRSPLHTNVSHHIIRGGDLCR